jgi:hypothetical protein
VDGYNAYNILVIKLKGEGGISRCQCMENIKMDFTEIGHVKIGTRLIWHRVL